MIERADLPRLDDLPIPLDVRPGPGWTEQMHALAAHIGAYHTMQIVASLGGQRIHVPRDPSRSPFLDLVGKAAAEKITWLYQGTRFEVPVARAAVARARRAGILVLVREGKMTIGDAAAVLGTTRNYVSYLVNRAQEGIGAEPTPRALLAPKDDRQLDLFQG